MAVEECGDGGREQRRPKSLGCGDAQAATWLGLSGTRLGLGEGDLVQRGDASVVIRAPCLGQAQAAGCAFQEPHAEPLLQRLEVLPGHLGRER